MNTRKKVKNLTKKVENVLQGQGNPPSTISIIDATHEEQLGRYCNVAIIHHTKLEFVFDFVWTLQGKSQLASRIVTSPQHAKKIYEVLGKNVHNYEKNYGIIK